MGRKEILRQWKLRQEAMKCRNDGGSGSGNWGHAGVPGQRGGSAPGGGKSNRVSLREGGYTSVQRERKEWNRRFGSAYDAASPLEADNAYRKQSGKVWQGLSDDAKKALSSYTGSGYVTINSRLREGKPPDKRGRLMTEAIEQSELKQDAMLYRGINRDVAETLFGLPPHSLNNVDPKKLIGLTGRDDAFASCGTCKGKGMSRQVQLEILAPKGTKALYAEPFSQFGDGDGLHWDARLDGKSTQKNFSHEQETILQRGTGFRIYDAEEREGKVVLKVIVTDQKQKIS